MGPALLERVASGDGAAVRACIDRFGGLVWALARRMSPSREEAEDAVQEVFLDLWRSSARFDPAVASETAFVAMIARRRLIDRRRKRQRAPSTESLADAPTPVEPSATRRVESSAEASLAAAALAQLRPEQRIVLVLSACHGLSHEEIASTTNLPLGTVKAHARRGLLRVREVLGASPAGEIGDRT
ncbi:MAG: sigma-70 family RNA polymerase sigma factor [Polyangiaceae bacterium]|nr:sigma-70 family RNA polymerase sigma factor [Polyangiaceae bacterium]